LEVSMATKKPSQTTRHKRFRPATELVHGGAMRSQFAETSEALFLTQGFVYPDGEAAEARFKGEDPGFVYSRYANPTVAMFEERMNLLEGAEASRAVASGMAAVTASLLCDLKAGDHVLASRALFGSCDYVIANFLPRFGVSSTLVDGTNLDEWRKAVRPETKAFFLESPSNPTLELIDIAGVAEIARKAGARLVVDNVFSTPLFQRPLELGAHTVVYSATKPVQRLGSLEGARDAGRAGHATGAVGGEGRGGARRAPGGGAALLCRPPESPAVRARPPPDDEPRQHDLLRRAGRKASGV
jgi:O-succinylhomoserine sulfhydrylase